MPFLAVNANADQPVAVVPQPLDEALERQLAVLPAGAPVLVMLHGYRYSPSHRRNDPHRAILAPGSQAQPQSWPRRMGFGRGSADEGLGIAFGWEAGGSLWRAYAEAGRAAQALAALIALIRARHPGPVGILAHSLGARVALAALPQLAPGDVGRMVLLAGAEFAAVAQTALASPAGQSAEVLNVTSRENDLYDFLFERLLAPFDLLPARWVRGWICRTAPRSRSTRPITAPRSSAWATPPPPPPGSSATGRATGAPACSRFTAPS